MNRLSLLLSLALLASTVSAGHIYNEGLSASGLWDHYVENSLQYTDARAYSADGCGLNIAARDVPRADDLDTFDALFELSSIVIDDPEEVYRAAVVAHFDLDGAVGVGITDGETVVGVARYELDASSTEGFVSFTAAYDPYNLDATTIEYGLEHSCGGPCGADAFQTFVMIYSIGEGSVTLGAQLGADQGITAANFVEDFDVSLNNPNGGRALSLVVYGGNWDNSYEIEFLGLAVEDDDIRVEAVDVADSFAAFYAAVFPDIWMFEHPYDGFTATFFSSEIAVTKDDCQAIFDDVDVNPAVAYQALVQNVPSAAFPLSGTADVSITLDINVEEVSSLPIPRSHVLIGVTSGIPADNSAPGGGNAFIGFARGDEQDNSAGHIVIGSLVHNNALGYHILNAEVDEFEVSEGAQDPAEWFGLTLNLNADANNHWIFPVIAGEDLEGASIDLSTFTYGGLDPNGSLQFWVLQRADGADEATAVSSFWTLLADVEIGCDGVANSGNELDSCGNCPTDDDYVCCPADVDQCGVCQGTDDCLDCSAVPNGPDDSCADCNGNIPATDVLDVCGVCGGDGTSCFDNDGVLCVGTVDQCGVCDGDDTTCFDVQGNVCPRTSYIDLCGVCDGDNSFCTGCDGVLNSGLAEDGCGVCGGDGTSCCDDYLGVDTIVWDYLLLPTTVWDLQERLEWTTDLIDDVLAAYPEDVIDTCGDKRSVGDESGNGEVYEFDDLCQLFGELAEFNMQFLESCLEPFCEEAELFQEALEMEISD